VPQKDTAISQNTRFPDPIDGGFELHNGISDLQVESRKIMITFNGNVWAVIEDPGFVNLDIYRGWKFHSTKGNTLPDSEGTLTAKLIVVDRSGKSWESLPSSVNIANIILPDVMYGDATIRTKYINRDIKHQY
jgi:hypothetical protein